MSDDIEDSWRGRKTLALVSRWARISTHFFSLQLAIQGLNFLSGMISVWCMAKFDYALATVAVSCLGSMVVLSDMGIAIGVTSIGGRVSRDSARFGSVVATALRLRWRLALFIFPLLAVIMMVMLHRAGADWWQVVIITSLAVAVATIELNDSLLSSTLLLRDRVMITQWSQFASSGLRLAIISLLALQLWLAATTALVATLLGTWLRYRILLSAARREVDLSAPEIADDRREILRLCRLEAPNKVFYCLQGQVTIGIMTYFGSTIQIADLGALGRISIFTLLLASFFHSVLIPSFNRIQMRDALIRRYLALLGIGMTAGLIMIILGAQLPGAVLWFLGPNYAHLQHEVPLMIVNLALGLMVTITWSINASKAWIATISRWNIPLTLLTQVAIAPLCQLETLHGILVFTIISQLPVLLLCLSDTWRGIRAVSPPLP